MSSEEYKEIIEWLERINRAAEPLSETFIVELELEKGDLKALRQLIKRLKSKELVGKDAE